VAVSRSTSGADFWVLHGDIRLENSDGLHAPVAVNLSATVREVVASLEPKDAEAPVINALRKEVDRRQIEFVKSGKLVPVAFSSRHYDFKRGKWVFGKAGDEVIADFFGAEGLLGDEVASTQYRVPSTQRGRSEATAGSGDGGEQQVPHFVRNDKGEVRNDERGAASLDWGSDGRAVFGDYAGAFAGSCGAVGGWGWVGADGGEWAEATAGLMGQAERFEARCGRRWRSWRRSTRLREGSHLARSSFRSSACNERREKSPQQNLGAMA
jgi:hypothetical protein